MKNFATLIIVTLISCVSVQAESILDNTVVLEEIELNITNLQYEEELAAIKLPVHGETLKSSSVTLDEISLDIENDIYQEELASIDIISQSIELEELAICFSYNEENDMYIIDNITLSTPNLDVPNYDYIEELNSAEYTL